MAVDTSTIGFYGLGSMGLRMATNLTHHLKRTQAAALHFSNRTLSKGDSLQTLGAIQEPDFVSLVRSCTVIFTMITNDQILRELVDSIITAGVPLESKVFVDCSTVHPDTSAEVAQLLQQRQARFVASPVFGASTVAEAGTLIFAMAGPATTIDGLEPLITGVMGRAIIRLGEDVRRSSLLKIAGNTLVIGFMELLSESHVFAEKTGLGTDVLHQFLSNMFGPTIESYSTRIISGSYKPPPGTPPGFSVSLAIKDTRHAVRIAQDAEVSLPTTQTALTNLLTARALRGDNLDSSAIYGTLRTLAGLGF